MSQRSYARGQTTAFRKCIFHVRECIHVFMFVTEKRHTSEIHCILLTMYNRVFFTPCLDNISGRHGGSHRSDTEKVIESIETIYILEKFDIHVIITLLISRLVRIAVQKPILNSIVFVGRSADCDCRLPSGTVFVTHVCGATVYHTGLWIRRLWPLLRAGWHCFFCTHRKSNPTTDDDGGLPLFSLVTPYKKQRLRRVRPDPSTIYNANAAFRVLFVRENPTRTDIDSVYTCTRDVPQE